MTDPQVPAKTFALLRPLAELAHRRGLPLYAVGGCVRDWMLGRREAADLDLVSEGDPTELARLAARLLGAKAESFGAFGTLRVKGPGLRVDFAASRQEEYPEPASLPKVRPAPLERDLFRRDFTINAMALRLESGRKGIRPAGALVDPYGGRRDLQARVLRALHPASFRDDPTRVFRAARFLCRFGLRPAPGLRTMVRESSWSCIAGRLSRHRIAAELLRILAEDDPAAPLRRLRAWGYLELVWPRLPVRVPGASVEERLGCMALALGPKAEEFLRSLPVERAMSQRLGAAVRLARQKTAPRTAPAPETARLVVLALPGLAESALKPLFLEGRDLRAAGLGPGPEMGAVLAAAGRAQWDGRIGSRREALSWLAKRRGRAA